MNPIDIAKFADENETATYRLPNNTAPVKYELWLKTDIDKGVFDFSGRVQILVKANEATQQVTVHHRQLTIDKIDLLNADKSLNQSNLNSDYDIVHEFLTIDLPFLLALDDLIVVDIHYSGTLRSDLLGFYRGSYLRDDIVGETVWYATTQFSMTEARHSMPCYDEPRLRAPIAISIQHDSSYQALSNMPVVSKDPVVGTNYVTSVFQDTPAMPTYIMGFVICDFAYITNNDLNPEQRVYAKPQSITRGEGDFMLSVVGPIVRQMEEHFQMPYPLPKLDHVSITDFHFNAMENFGLITYRESRLLFNPNTDPDYMKLDMIEIISHEYAHHYFGNIVAVNWWAYTWLKEGFATLFSCVIPDMLYPNDDWIGRFRTKFNGQAFSRDLVEFNARPLNYYVEEPTNIRSKFDTISYSKGGSVLMMFQEAFTIETFTKGLRYYLSKHYFSSTTPDDLHAALQQALDEDYPGNNVDVNKVMRTWEDQAGYPVVRVQKIGNNVILTQTRVGGGNESYAIPISFATKASPDFADRTPKLWMDNRSLTISFVPENDWIILNLNQISYYKVSYERSIWLTFIDGLKTDHQSIASFHRARFFIDMGELLESEEELLMVDGLEMMSYLGLEGGSSVWSEVHEVEDIFSTHLFATAASENYQKFIHSLVQPHIDRLGFEEKMAETDNDRKLRRFVASLACKSLHEDCLNYELKKLVDYVSTGEFTEINLCAALRLANQSIHTAIVNEMFEAPDKSPYLYELGCSLDRNIIENYLMIIADGLNSMNSVDRSNVIEYIMRQSPLGLDTIIEFTFFNWRMMNDL